MTKTAGVRDRRVELLLCLGYISVVHTIMLHAYTEEDVLKFHCVAFANAINVKSRIGGVEEDIACRV